MGYEAEADLKLASVKAVFAGDVVITEDDIELYGPDGNKMEFNFEYGNRTAEIKFKNTFDYDSEYILKLSKNISAGGNYMGYDEEYSFKIPQVLAFSEFTVNEAEDIVKISFVLNN